MASANADLHTREQAVMPACSRPSAATVCRRSSRPIREQAGRLLHGSSLYLSEPVIALAEEIAELSGIEGVLHAVGHGGERRPAVYGDA